MAPAIRITHESGEILNVGFFPVRLRMTNARVIISMEHTTGVTTGPVHVTGMRNSKSHVSIEVGQPISSFKKT